MYEAITAQNDYPFNMGVYELTGDMKYQKLHSDHVSLQVSYSFG